MAATYKSVKAAVVDVVDDFTALDVVAGYGSKYNAKTKLEKLGLSAPVMAVMPPRYNKKLRLVVQSAWHPVGSIDLVAQSTIGELILLACGQSGVLVPTGEPI